MRRCQSTAALRYDYLVAGAGFAGLNAVSGLKRFKPDASVLLVDSRAEVGGSWNDYYDFCNLHAPHPTFGVAGHKWPFADPSALATRDQVLDHFSTFRRDSGVDFRGSAAATAYERTGDGGVAATLSDGSTVVAGQCVRAGGYNFAGHDGPGRDVNLPSGAAAYPEVEVRDLSAAVASAERDRTYVVVGGGKTGLDACLFLGKNKRSGDDVLLAEGRPKCFLIRDTCWPDAKNKSVFKPAVTEVFLDMILRWDGTAEAESDILRGMVDEGHCIAISDGDPTHTELGIVSLAEAAAVRETCARIVSGDHYAGVSTRADGGGASIEFRRGGAHATAKEVVIVNCRTSAPDVHAYNRDVHPRRPDGSLAAKMPNARRTRPRCLRTPPPRSNQNSFSALSRTARPRFPRSRRLL